MVMIPGKYEIMITLIYRGERHLIHTYTNEYYSLMTLISDKLGIPGFGLCCGMGSCGTCLVQIRDKYLKIQRNELACSIQINDFLANTEIIITEPNY